MIHVQFLFTDRNMNNLICRNIHCYWSYCKKPQSTYCCRTCLAEAFKRSYEAHAVCM